MNSLHVTLQDWVNVFLRVSSSNFTYLVDLSQVEGCKLLFTQKTGQDFLSKKVAFLLYKVTVKNLQE